MPVSFRVPRVIGTNLPYAVNPRRHSIRSEALDGLRRQKTLAREMKDALLRNRLRRKYATSAL
jgi:hypothetical protein